MIQIEKFVFNSFQVNTFILHDETGECVIIDAACQSEAERTQLTDFISHHQLRPICLLNTHSHIDHILGNVFLKDTYQLPLMGHQSGDKLISIAQSSASLFGFELERVALPDKHLTEGDSIRFGNSEINVLYTPGHADGSICFYHAEQQFVIVGDVLFQGSIGRTDLPTGNYHTLMESIGKKLLVLPETVTVYPGHGPTTSIGYEKQHNPFLESL